MSLVGADIGLLRKLIAQLSGPMQSDVNSVLTDMNDQVQASSTYWVAEDGDRFRAAFAAFVQSTKTQLDERLANAAKTTGQNLQAIGSATGEVTGKPAAAGQGQGSAGKSLGWYWTEGFIPQPGNVVPPPWGSWTDLLSTESKAILIRLPRFLIKHYEPGEGLLIHAKNVPAWATDTSERLQQLSFVVSVVHQGIETYSEDKLDHPTWSGLQLWSDVIGQAGIIGGISGTLSWWAGKVTGKWAEGVGVKAAQSQLFRGQPATQQTAEEVENAANTEQAAEQAAGEAQQSEAAAEAATEAAGQAETATASAVEQAVTEAAQAVAQAEAAAAQAVAEATAEAAQITAETVAGAAETATAQLAAAAAQAATQATADAQSAQEALQAAEEIAAQAEQSAAEIAAQAAQTASQASAAATQAAQEAAAARAAAQTGTEGVTGTTAEAGTQTAVEAGTQTAVEAGTEVTVEAGTEVAAEAGAETAAEALGVMGTDALVGAVLGSEVPVIGNVVGLVVGFAVGAAVSFFASKLGTAIGHTVWDAGGETVHEADHLFHDLF
jgi:hypothetical protein